MTTSQKLREIKNDYTQKITNELKYYFNSEIFNNTISQAKINILENKTKIINDVAVVVEKIPHPSHYNKSYYLYELEKTKSDVTIDINNIFIKTFKEHFKEYELKTKILKDYHKDIIYNKLQDDIKEALNQGQTIENILAGIKTSDYKKLCYNDLYGSYASFDENIANEFYHTLLNKVARDYKNDPTTQENDPDINIPLGWKIYGIVKAFGVINKKIWK